MRLLGACIPIFAGILSAADAERVTVCQLQSIPEAYQHKLVEVTGFVSRGFEDSLLFDSQCPKGERVWVEYGGTAGTGVIRCCEVAPTRRRTIPMSIDGIAIPLIEDAAFRELDRLLQIPPDRVVHARMIGRFFASSTRRIAAVEAHVGYGHMGCCSLFVVQQVLSVGAQDRKDLDYRASLDQPDWRSYWELMPSAPEPTLAGWQQTAEQPGGDWRFDEPLRVVSEVLAQRLNLRPFQITELRKLNTPRGRLSFAWTPRDRRNQYTIVVSRPYELSLHAKDPSKVAWVVRAIWERSRETK